MKLLIINILLLTASQASSQTALGIGLVSIDFDDNTVLEFYSDTLDTVPEKVIAFFDDKSINSWNIKNLDEQKKWLSPESLWLDYSAFSLRILTRSDKWFDVIVNNETGKTYWLRDTELTEFEDWEKYLKHMFGVARLPEFKQKIRTKPAENAQEITYNGADCFIIKSMSGDWVEIVTPDQCNEGYTGSGSPIKSGWIKWRRGDALLINYFITS